MASSNEIWDAEGSSGFNVGTPVLGSGVTISGELGVGWDSGASMVAAERGACDSSDSAAEGIDMVSALPPLFLRFCGGGGLMTKSLGLMTPFARNTTSRHRLQSSS